MEGELKLLKNCFFFFFFSVRGILEVTENSVIDSLYLFTGDNIVPLRLTWCNYLFIYLFYEQFFIYCKEEENGWNLGMTHHSCDFNFFFQYK